MSKPYTKDMWDAEKKEALREYLISSRDEDKRYFRKIITYTVIIILFAIFLYFFQDIIHYINTKDSKITKNDELVLIQDTVNNLIKNKKVKDNDTVYMFDLYQGKYGLTISPIYSHTGYPYQCIGYILIEDGKINTNHYCDMYE